MNVYGVEQVAWDTDMKEFKRNRGSAALGHRIVLPDDLSDWVLPATLEEWIQQETEKLQWGACQGLECPLRDPENRLSLMLRLLAFAYATGRLSSEEIVDACHTESTFLLLCEGEPPFANEVSSFRRRNRRLLETILARVFEKAIGEASHSGLSRVPEAGAHQLLVWAAERLDVARHLDRVDG